MVAFLVPPVFGLVIGLAAGGRLANFAQLRLRRFWLLAIAVLPQVVLVYLPPAADLDPMRLVLPATFVPLAGFLWSNRQVAGMWLVALGFASNAAVILANGGLMPTNVDALRRAGLDHQITAAQERPGMRLARSKDIVLPVEATRLWWLSDVLVSPPLPRPKVMSPGDLAIAAGLAVLAAQAVRGRAEPHAAGAAA